jgi:cell division protein FtsZ
VEEAAKTATMSPLLERSIEGAKRLLLNVVGSEDLSLMEAALVVERVREATGNEDVDILYGVTYDERAQDELRVILIAAGFGESAVVKPVRSPAPTLHADIRNLEIPAFLRYGDEDLPLGQSA